MRVFILLLIVVFSSIGLACPNLSGDFECRSRDGEFIGSFKMRQAEIAHVTQFTLTNDDGLALFIADNQVRPYPENESQGIRESTLRSWCEEDSALHVEWISKAYSDNLFAGTITEHRRFGPLPNGKYELMMEESFIDPNGSKKTDGDSYVCEKIAQGE